MNEYPLRLTPDAAFDRVQKENAFLLDVRFPEEFVSVHARDAANIPLNDLAAHVKELPRDRPIIVICGSGTRSQAAAETLRRMRLTHVSDIEGGMGAWEAAGLPTTVNRSRMPLDRQFRLIVGGFVFAFTLGGAFVSRWLLLGSGFVGLMLGLTALLGICPMMDALRKMPWNRVS